MSAAHRSFLVIDPAQDYEESDQVLGVFGSLAAAQMAARLLRHKTGEGTQYWMADSYRVVEVQEWKGREHLATWSYSPDYPQWTHRKENR